MDLSFKIEKRSSAITRFHWYRDLKQRPSVKVAKGRNDAFDNAEFKAVRCAHRNNLGTLGDAFGRGQLEGFD